MTIREQIASIPSPAFTTTYPKIYHSEWIPQSIAAHLEPIWQKARHHDGSIRVFRFTDVYTAGQGLVFDSDIRAIPESVSQHTQADINEAASLIREYLQAGVETVYEDTMVLVKPGWFNYGHWLIELLPQPFLVEKAGLDIQPQIFLPKTDSVISRIHKDSLSAIGVDKERIIDYNFTPRLYKSLILVSGHSNHGLYMSATLFEALDRCKYRIVGSGRKKGRRIYVQRSKSFSRIISNEADIVDMLAKHGFETIVPESMSLAEQIETFTDCEISIGVSGAALTNICWQKPGSACIGLYPANMPDTFFWQICQHRRIRLADVRCPVVVNREGYNMWNGDIQVSPNDIDMIMNNILSGSI